MKSEIDLALARFEPADRQLAAAKDEFGDMFSPHHDGGLVFELDADRRAQDMRRLRRIMPGWLLETEHVGPEWVRVRATMRP